MGKLHQFGNVIIRIYGRDHRPAHFHVISPDYQALIEIETMSVHSGSLPGRLFNDVLAWAVPNRALLVAEWNRNNPDIPVV